MPTPLRDTIWAGLGLLGLWAIRRRKTANQQISSLD